MTISLEQSAVCIQAVAFGNNIVYGQPAGDQTVAVAKGPPPATAYAVPQMTVWQWPGGPAVPTEPEGTSNDFFFDYVEDMFQAVVDAHEVCIDCLWIRKDLCVFEQRELLRSRCTLV